MSDTRETAQQWMIDVATGLRVFACDCIPNNASGEIATLDEAATNEADYCLRSVVLLSDAAAALDASPAPTLAQLLELEKEWRANAQTHENHRHVRLDPYDDVGHEHSVKARILKRCADELSAAIHARETANE